MCGRIYVKQQLLERIAEQSPTLFERLERKAVEKVRASGNVCPTQSLFAFTSGPGLEVMRWGWSRRFNDAIINARSDSLDKPMWASALRERRCFVPVSGYFEWTTPPLRKGKIPYAFSLAHQRDMYLGCLWERHKDLGPCFSVITVEATAGHALIHERMPLILTPEQAEKWIDPDLEEPRAREMCKPYTGDMLQWECAKPSSEVFPHPNETGFHEKVDPKSWFKE